jgi:ankyrin repeat protein
MLLEDEFACNFLLKHGALPTLVEPDTGLSPLHLLAAWNSQVAEDTGKLLLSKGSDPNVVAHDGSTPLHCAVRSCNKHLIKVLLNDMRTDCERQDKVGCGPLWYALQDPKVCVFSLHFKFIILRKENSSLGFKSQSSLFFKYISQRNI